MKSLLRLCLIGLVLSSCGGGGGGGTVPFVAGIWRGTAPVLVVNDCGLDLPIVFSSETWPHTVNQIDGEVALSEATGETYAGRFTESNRFVTRGNATTAQVPGGVVRVAPSISYFDIDGDSATVFFYLETRIELSDGTALDCDFAYRAVARRQP